MDVVRQNFIHLIKGQSSYLKCHRIVCEFIDHFNHESYLQVNAIETDKITKTFRALLVKQKFVFSIDPLLHDLITIANS